MQQLGACEEIQKQGHVERGHVGLRLRDRPAEGSDCCCCTSRLPLSRDCSQGDIITELDDEYVDSPAMLVLMLTRLPIGNEVTLKVLREDEVLQVPVRVGRRPKE